MRAITDAREFSGALNRLSQLLPQSSIPALEGVYVRFSGGRCNLTATDLSTWLTVEIPAQGEDFAFVLTRAKRIAKACRRSSGEMSLELAETGEGGSSACACAAGLGPASLTPFSQRTIRSGQRWRRTTRSQSMRPISRPGLDV